ncbi:DNA alkylation repair protein [Carboxylicivirga marina]|uniref:DNA alkylation repair protein n=1 Tax=Carboxylicivirga marina TaxID=2800988 RepID=A0ABS1HP05_9BACT|nr:DNA alkylation repair protein [Carboxylicivirga marina]MBK3519423.1 DNA alkylation repair protein [Carboxylicivirga marina]
MIVNKIKAINQFCIANSDEEIIKKYARYFKEGYDGYGIEQKAFETQRDKWIAAWQDEMTLDDYLDLADELFKHGKLEEKSFAMSFINAQRTHYSKNTFERIGKWFDYGIDNWATADVLCMLVLSSFLIDKVIDFDELKTWNNSDNEWQRRAVPVTLNELLKKGLQANDAIQTIAPLMLDKSIYVQKGIGTLLRGLWKKYPEPIEKFLLEWKDTCGRPIIQYATEKMDKEDRKKFRKTK